MADVSGRMLGEGSFIGSGQEWWGCGLRCGSGMF